MYTIIVAPIDVAVPAIAKQILDKALFYLQNSECQLSLLAVAPANADENALDEIRGKLMEFTESHTSTHEGRIHLHVTKGLPSDQILNFSNTKDVDFILMGSHRGDSSQLGRAALGSTAAKVASQAKCDVCIIKAE